MAYGRLSLVMILAVLAAGPALAGNAQALNELFEREWAFRLAEFPMFATYTGVHEYNDKLAQVSPADEARRAERWRGFLAELGRIPREDLSTEEQINYSLFARQLEDAIAGYESGAWQIPLNADSGFHSAFARLPRSVPLRTEPDYAAYIARLQAWPGHVDQQIANMRLGLERGMTLPKTVLANIDASIRPHVVLQPEDSVFFAPFEAMPATIPEVESARIVNAGRRAIMGAVVPAYERFLDFMLEEYVSGARDTLAASELPGGEAYYAQRIRFFTTLDMTAGEIHAAGLAEVERIRGEMAAVMARTGFDGGFADFLHFLRTDPRFYAADADSLLREAAWIAKSMDGKLPSLFATLPRLPYGVAPVPAHLAARYTAGRYVPPAQDSGQPGWYWVNTHKLESRPLYALPALTLHEAVPGHHLQFALALEQDEQPPFRRFDYISAFGEGWALYAEWLGVEAGIYDTPYKQFGRLTYEMWRACRLVVDTGLHAMGWSRAKAIDYLAAHTALSLHEVETEVDRYISWPGQALSYKLGEMKIRALRKHAESELGSAFDVRTFHDAVLVNGSVTLPLLEEAVARYIVAAKAR